MIGIDEAGRGPLAGPLVVAGVKVNSKFNPRSSRGQNAKFWKDIKDSKKLTPKRREEWFQILTFHPRIEWAAARISPRVIDRINIARSANLGAYRVFKKLTRAELNHRDPSVSFQDDALRRISSVRVLLDGSLYLPRHIRHETIIKGDEKIPLIAAASIIAKVTRDRMMARLHQKFPEYGFERHKGYGTRAHMESLKRHGVSAIHRLSFCKRL